MSLHEELVKDFIRRAQTPAEIAVVNEINGLRDEVKALKRQLAEAKKPKRSKSA